MHEYPAPMLAGVRERSSIAVYEQMVADDAGSREVSGQPTGPPDRDVEG
jgi:hypothetical protein